MVHIGCIETSVKNYELVLCNNPKEQRLRLQEHYSKSAQSRLQLYYLKRTLELPFSAI